jgi:hypothetical protein
MQNTLVQTQNTLVQTQKREWIKVTVLDMNLETKTSEETSLIPCQAVRIVEQLQVSPSLTSLYDSGCWMDRGVTRGVTAKHDVA